VAVEANNKAGIDATVNIATSSGDLAISIALAFNTVGWSTQNLLFNLVDTILGDPLIAEALGANTQAEAFAWIEDTDVTATDLLITAHGDEQVNATVSNAASSEATALYGAKGMAVGGIIASNKVRSAVHAWFQNGTATIGGPVDIVAVDASGIFSNVKMVSSSVTTNDGGVGVLQDEISNTVKFQYLNTEGLRAPKFGERVRIAPDSIGNDFTSNDDAADLLQNSSRVQVADDYGSYRLTSKSGKRLLITGDNVLFEDGYGTGGVADTVYRYLGPNGRVDLEGEDYSVTARWAKLGG
jgi:hypothetical protein